MRVSIKRKNISGFSMVELVTAMAILAVGVTAIVTSFHYGLQKVRTMKEMAAAQTAVQNEIEKLRAMPASELNMQGIEDLPVGPALQDLVNVRKERTISAYRDPKLKLHEVTVSVRWTGDAGRTMKYAATTLVGYSGEGKP